jgi:cytochrome c556
MSMRVAPIAALLAVTTVHCSGNTAPRGDSPASAAVPPSSDRGTATTPSGDLERTDDLPGAARQALHEPMRRHAENMEVLLRAALMLDYAGTAAIADRILDEPRVSRAPGDPDAVNAAFPPEFFRLQDQLYSAATELAAAARQRDDAALAGAFARLSRTCVSCHSIYLRMPRQD